MPENRDNPGDRAVAEALSNLARDQAPASTRYCLPLGQWALFAAGSLPVGDSTRVLEHAASCDHCGSLLRALAEDPEAETETSREELPADLQSLRPEWQARVAQRMSDLVPRPRTGRTPSWVKAAAGVAAVALASTLLWQHSRPSLAKANQLIVEAYGTRRPFALRLFESSYSPVRERRGRPDPIADRPQSLLEAQARIARGLAGTPEQPDWLQAKARAQLLEGRWDDAVELLQRAMVSRPEDVVLARDLAVALHERGHAEDRPEDLSRAIPLFDRVLVLEPDDRLALFDRAIALERAGRHALAAADWEHYLRLEPTGPWSDEARARLATVRPTEAR